MPKLQRAILLHAVHYMQLLYDQNQSYLRGGEEQFTSLQKFELELPTLKFIQERQDALTLSIQGKDDLSEMDRAFLEVSNTIPDAGAYLVNLKLGAQERIRWLKNALLASQRLRNDVTTQAHLGNLGLAYHELGDLSQAVEYLQQALQVAENIGDQYHQGAWLGNLGNVFSLQGEHEKAIEYHKRHLELMRETQDKRGEGHALANLGVSYAFLGEHSAAIENYTQHLSLAKQLGDQHEESRALMNLGFAYYDAGNLDAASNSLNSALVITAELGDTVTRSLVIGGLADIAIDRNEYIDAIQMLLDAVKPLQGASNVEAELRLIQSLGNAYSASSDFEHALQTFSQLYELAKSIGAKATMCSALANQCNLYRRTDDFYSARRIGNQALELVNQTNSQSNEAFVRWQFALIDEANGDIKSAKVQMQRVIAIEERLGSLDVDEHREHLKNLVQQAERSSSGDTE